MDLEKLGRRIREARKKEGFTQEGLAEKTKLSKDHISLIERGQSDFKIQTFVALVNALNVSPNAILCDVVLRSTDESELISKIEKLSDTNKSLCLIFVNAMLANQ